MFPLKLYIKIRNETHSKTAHFMQASDISEKALSLTSQIDIIDMTIDIDTDTQIIKNNMTK